MAYLIRRSPGPNPVTGLPRGHYAKSFDPNSEHGWAILCCPSCAKPSTVGSHHTVSEKGLVSPSYVCPFKGCMFHTYIELDRWQDTEEQIAAS